ncbi:MAG: 4'-phosphopantetheinyl transferase superfamily protein [Anaerolineaceae bacterium]|nr:4'-phosphopantetheinyl transferase superfamily protein [Anaerolineaceae bacterium]
MSKLLWNETLPDDPNHFSTIDLYLINMPDTGLHQRFHNILQETELQVANAYMQEHRHHLSVASRTALRLLLSLYINEHPAEIILQKNEFQKPLLSDAYELNFNVSHTNEQILIGFSRLGPIGVDMEFTQSNIDWPMIAKRYFSPAENEKINNATVPQHAFYQLWTAKEAFMKGVGSGFQFPLHHFFINYQDQEHGKVISTIPLYPPDWMTRNFDLSDDCVGAIASPTDLNQLRCFHFNTNSINKIAALWHLP